MKIAMLLSGGVDSSVALHLLTEQGHNVTAFYLKIWLEDEFSSLGACPWQEDLRYARAVCKKLGVPLQVIPMQREYRDTIVSYTLDEIKKGYTPNPDVMCNRYIKFGAFLDHFGKDFDKVATGHYAQITEVDGDMHLLCSPDKIKDQTYFLSYLCQDQLKKVLFPIGHLEKYEVRALAEKYGLLTADRKDSQGLCFLGKIRFREFIEHHVGQKPGDIVEWETGKKLGDHKGYWFYTIGQRQGSGLSGGPWYVVAKSPTENIVYMSRNYYAEDKQRMTFDVHNCNWIGQVPCGDCRDLHIKVRHGAFMHHGTVEIKEDGTARVVLHEHDQGLAPGQFAAFYEGNRCLGSGIITCT